MNELFAHVSEELRLEKVELNRAETRVHNVIEFIASGRATPTLADALSGRKDHAFTPPPRTWITARIGKLNHLLATRTEKSALALRRLAGAKQDIQQHLKSFLQHVHDASGKRLPKYVENEFRRYLECGLYAHGFARAVCETCGDELLLPFSCKLRGSCPSCNARRMSNTAAHLSDHVIAPDLTLQQWVLTVPFELRLLVATKPEALSAIGRIFVQEIQRWQREQARALGYERPETAALSFCQRFGSSLNLNIHWHVILPDVVFLPDAAGEQVGTLKHRAPTRLDLEEIVTIIAIRSIRWLEKHGYLRSEDDGRALGREPRPAARARSARDEDMPRLRRAHARMIKDGDGRSLNTLKRLQTTSGRGFLGFEDCYPSLRRGTALEDAIKAVTGRAAPKF